MDLDDIARNFDVSMRAALEEVYDQVHDEHVSKDNINHEIAKSVLEWSVIFGAGKSKVYVKLNELVAEGKWEKIAATSPGVSGRAMHFYYPAGMNPFLEEE